MKSSSFGLVEVKDEMESEEEDHDKSPKKSEVAVKKEVQRRLLCVCQLLTSGLANRRLNLDF